ncbi:MAG: flagellar hook-length control protein FliK [Alphaproteobacteria bacterium]|nr:flagellar hook-length control protein FliK [Alphaproteobacteria bacterium]
MQVNATNQAKPTNPLDGLIAEKPQGQTAEEAFAAVLAQAGLNMQGMLSGSYQAPQALKQAIDKPERAAVKEIERPQAREPQGRAVARGRDEDKTTGQERAAEVRPDARPDAKPGRAEAANESDRKAGEADTVEVSTPADQIESNSVEQAEASETSANPAAQANTKEAGAATTIKVEEKVTLAMTAFAAQIGLADDAATIALAGDEDGDAAAMANMMTGPKIAAGPVKAEATETQAVHFAAQALFVEGEGDETGQVENAVAALTQVATKTAKAVESETGAASLVQQNGDSLKDEQAAMLSRIVGNDGQVKVESGAKSSATVSQSSATLVPGLVLAETEMTEAVMAANNGFDGQMDDMLAGNQGKSGNGAAVQIGQPTAAQAAATALAAAQTQTASFTDAMIQAQGKAGGEVVKEIQGVQGTSAASNTQPTNGQSGLNQPQAAQDLKSANAAQHVEKPHEIRQPVQAKEILDQINVQISKAAKDGLDKITVQLRPEALGRVEVQLKLGHEGQLTAQIIADRPETLEALKRDVRSLEQSLSDAGFKTDSGSLQFSLRGEQQSQQQKEANGQNRFGFERGQALDEAAAEDAIAQSRSRPASRSGVDISV